MEQKSLRWRQRRGMKELDVLLERYYTRHYDSASVTERDMFARLLDREDPEIWLWIVGQAPAPAEFEHVIARLRRHD
jgi:antitoxin CptB